MKRLMINDYTGEQRPVKEGFSFTTLFFGVFVPLFRGDFKWFVIMLLLGVCTMGLSWLVMPFIYNKMYTKDLIKKGFKFKTIDIRDKVVDAPVVDTPKTVTEKCDNISDSLVSTQYNLANIYNEKAENSKMFKWLYTKQAEHYKKCADKQSKRLDKHKANSEMR